MSVCQSSASSTRNSSRRMSMVERNKEPLIRGEIFAGCGGMAAGRRHGLRNRHYTNRRERVSNPSSSRGSHAAMHSKAWVTRLTGQVLSDMISKMVRGSIQGMLEATLMRQRRR
jgi:hypothetical protein